VWEVSVLCALWYEVVVFGVYLKAAFKTQPKSSSDICHIVFEILVSLIDFKNTRTKGLTKLIVWTLVEDSLGLTVL
jgi:hypothetical protein